ncbi:MULTISPECIES: hypothetical protein [unclassified Mycolicibacterium]|jgi:hypothetical protein|uniref:hypothetical protein n=1 Tax=unclassified Mycolicibacterium TaxID=2636767 RepID=UPI00224B9CB6|nr:MULTISPECIES: hypothetical protein [unclassified Mycolicibacterium]MCX2710826.1 hypothetical protein [Mycolicibacterium sp. J2]MDX1871906.1 hypothetical protein [Mycolicibacterium sp. 120266]
MNTQPPSRSRRALLGVVGAGALITLGALSATHSAGGPTSMLAGSGDAPANTTYSSPVVQPANMGATATWTTPATVEPTTMAVPKKG